MKLKELAHLVRTAVKDGVQMALSSAAPVPEWLSKAEAYRLYGRSDVDRWIAEGLIIPATNRGQFHKPLLKREQLEAVAAASNRHTYLPAAER